MWVFPTRMAVLAFSLLYGLVKWYHPMHRIITLALPTYGCTSLITYICIAINGPLL
jgi:hypothetical protein